MKLHMRGAALIALAAGVLVAAPVAQLAAQELKPVAVVAVSSVDEVLGDVAYLTEAGGWPDFGRMAVLMSAQYTTGIDKSKPWGGVVTTDGMNFNPLVFIPVTDLDAWLTALAEQIGEATDVGEGIKRVAGPQPIFIKARGGWAFISNNQDLVAGDLPEDPIKLLDGLDAEYDIAIRGYVNNVPPIFRQMAIMQINAGAEQAADNAAPDNEQGDAQRKIMRNSMKQLETLINEADTVTLGWNIDTMNKTTNFDFAMTAVEDTTLARRVEKAGETTSSHTGFLMPGAAVTANFSQEMTEEDIAQMLPMLANFRQRTMEELDKDEDLDDEATRAAAKDVIGSLFDVLTKTFEGGKMDGGAVLMLQPKSLTVVVGGLIADGATLESALKKLVAIAEKEEDFPGIAWNADSHAGVEFHTMTVPIPEDEDARDVLGPELNVVVGIGANSAFLAAGHEASSVLKQVLDKSAEGTSRIVPASQMTVAVEPIVNFVSSVEENPIVTAMAAELEKTDGKDHVSIRTIPIKNGVISRIEIEEGVLRAIGQAAKAAMGGGPGAAAPGAF